MPTIEPNLEPNSNDTQAAIAAGMLIAQVQEVEGVPVIMRPDNWTLCELHDLMPHPNRVKADVTAHTLQSFLDYWNRYADAQSTAFINSLTGAIDGIIDYHDATGNPGWCDHRVCYALPKTPDWVAWCEASGQPKSQAEFAAWLEDHIDEVAEPAGAELLEVARTLEAKKQLNFRSGLRLDNGAVQLTYVEDIEGKAGAKGQLQIPTDIKLGLRLIRGGDAYEVPARFRYRIKDGGCVMWFELVRPDRVWDAAVADIVARLREGMLCGQLIEGQS